MIATHGRGIWIVDDLAPLRALSSEVLSQEVAFLPARLNQQRMSGRGGWSEGDATYVGPAAPGGALIMEIGAGQACAMRRIVDQISGYGSHQLLYDAAGLERVVIVERIGT